MSETARSSRDLREMWDLRWLLGMLTGVSAIIYVVLLITVPALRRPWTLVSLTILLLTHLGLHWLLLRVRYGSRLLNWYVLLQGGLFLVISLLSANPSLIFPLFSSLLAEAIGMFGLTRRGFLASFYYLLLIAFIFYFVFDPPVFIWMILGTAAVIITTALYTLLYKRQMEARSRAQILLEELEEANHKLSNYADKVEKLTTTAERQRMARELHDTLSQGLAGLILQLEAVEAHLTGMRPEKALTIVQDAQANARETLAESRQAIQDLRDTGQPDLEESIRQEAEHFTASTGIPCSVVIDLPQDVSEEVSGVAVRVVSEGLTNIARHARAGRADLRIVTNETQEVITIEICDNGIGFEPQAVRAGHYGVLGMGERVRLAGGEFDIHSSSGDGTRILIQLPLHNGRISSKEIGRD